ncbi:MAG: cation transporter [Gemmatimonadetes bacterium]|nr:cation transporter [Gemmatimonadota bacterium]
MRKTMLLALVLPMFVVGMATAGENCTSTSAASSCSAKKADAATASAEGCCAAKAAAAKTASAEGCCAEKAAAATAAAAGAECASKVATAGAGAECASKVATAGAGACTGQAKTASAGACTASKAECASKVAAAGSSCEAGKAAAQTAEAGKCGDGCTKPCCAAHTYQLTVSGMTCGGCAAKVEGAVKSMENVAGVWVDWEHGTATVTSQAEMNGEEIAKAISATGFEAHLVAPEKAETTATM